MKHTERTTTYEIERVTHGIDRYYVELTDSDVENSEQFAIELVERGDVGLDFHEDTDWGPFVVTEVHEIEDEWED